MMAMADHPPELSLVALRRMMEGVVPPVMCTASPEGVPHVNYLSLAEYVDPLHIALSFQFFNRSRKNVLATRRAAVSFDDPYTGAGVVMQLEYVRVETGGPVFERLRARLAGVASHAGMENVFELKGADIYKVLDIRRVPGRKELPGILPRVDLAANARVLSERMASCEDLPDLIDTILRGLSELLRIEHAMLWLLDPARAGMTLLASRGYDHGGTGAEISLGEGLAGTAAREGVPVRVGHMMNMATYGRAARVRAKELGLSGLLKRELPLPGLAEPRSQLALPLRARGTIIGVLFVESLHEQFFGYDDEDVLMPLCGQLALALAIMQSPEPDALPAAAAVPSPPALAGPALRVRRYVQDNSIFFDDVYLIRGMAGAILWKLLGDFTASGRVDFTNRELRLAPELNLSGFQDNLEVRLVMLQRRLSEYSCPIRIQKTGRGRFQMTLARSVELEEVPHPLRAAGA